MSEERPKYKLDFYDAFLKDVNRERDSGHNIIVCGDFNTAHKEIDLARPRENSNISGFFRLRGHGLTLSSKTVTSTHSGHSTRNQDNTHGGVTGQEPVK
nr:endonuclease/exonuclease/phosphatase family protein [Methanothermobacter sp. DP]